MMEPPFMGAPSVLLVARLAKAQAWLHVQDLEVDAAFALGLLRSGWMSRLAFGMERRIKAMFSGISTISSAMAARVQRKLDAAALPPVFPNWVDMDVIYPLAAPSVLREELKVPPDTVVALYAGNMGNKQGLELVVAAAKQLADQPGLVFVFCGEGVAAQGLRGQTEEMENVRWLPLQPLERLNALLNLADVHLLPQRADAADLVMPSKLTGMMASGRPVVATAHPDTEVARAVRDAGMVTQPGDVGAFCDALLTLASNVDLRARLGHAARRYAIAHWEKDTVLARFEDALRTCAMSGMRK